VQGTFWIGLYLCLALAPMFLMMAGPRPSGRSFWAEFGLGLGFVGLAQLAMQFALIARHRWVTEPYGIDTIMRHHRQLALMSFVLILLHPVILVLEVPAWLPLLHPFGGTWASRTGTWAVLALALLVGLSLWRRRLRMGYETWRLTHTLLGVAALGFALAHVLLVSGYVNEGWKRLLWIAFSIVMLASLVHLRLIKPILQRRRGYRVAGVRPDRGRNFVLTVEPVGHAGLRFLPGQFAWLKLGRDPYTLEEHPFSFSSSAETRGEIEFGIKSLGDFTTRLRSVACGTPAYLDGPFGSFSIDLVPAAGYVLIAGGIGVTPMVCFLRTMADRGDVRPVLLIHAARRWEGMAFRDELEELRARLNLSVVPIVEEAPEEWPGERGRISPDFLARHLPEEKIRRACFVCGPNAMMDAVQDMLVRLGVPAQDIHSERFDLI
jgi:predicted ferric reductase